MVLTTFMVRKIKKFWAPSYLAMISEFLITDSLLLESEASLQVQIFTVLFKFLNESPLNKGGANTIEIALFQMGIFNQSVLL